MSEQVTQADIDYAQKQAKEIMRMQTNKMAYRAALREACNGDTAKANALYQKHAERLEK